MFPRCIHHNNNRKSFSNMTLKTRTNCLTWSGVQSGREVFKLSGDTHWPLTFRNTENPDVSIVSVTCVLPPPPPSPESKLAGKPH